MKKKHESLFQSHLVRTSKESSIFHYLNLIQSAIFSEGKRSFLIQTKSNQHV